MRDYFNQLMGLKKFFENTDFSQLEDHKKSMLICIENYRERLEGYLLGINKSFDSMAILLRGCIEATLLLNLFYHNKDIAKKFYEKRHYDALNIKVMYQSGINRRYNGMEFRLETIPKRDRFDYIGELYPNSLVDLVDYTTFNSDMKLFFKWWIKRCDNAIHPHLLVIGNESYDLFGENGIITTLHQLMMDLVHEIFEIEMYKVDETISINEDFTPEINQYIEIKNILHKKDQTVLIVLWDEFLSHYIDLEWAYHNQRKYLFYIKIRFIIEFFGIFTCLLTHPELQILYQLHSEILKKDFFEIWVKYDQSQVVKEQEKRYLLRYEKCLNELKLIYQKKLNIDYVRIKHHIKRTNGWAISLLGHKAPKTIDLIKEASRKLLDSELGDYLNGLYVESSEYCHISCYSIEQPLDHSIIDTHRFVIDSILNTLIVNIKRLLAE